VDDTVTAQLRSTSTSQTQRDLACEADPDRSRRIRPLRNTCQHDTPRIYTRRCSEIEHSEREQVRRRTDKPLRLENGVRKIDPHGAPHPDILRPWRQLLSLPIPCHVHWPRSCCRGRAHSAAVPGKASFRPYRRATIQSEANRSGADAAQPHAAEAGVGRL
jgi:hypothetical protein